MISYQQQFTLTKKKEKTFLTIPANILIAQFFGKVNIFFTILQNWISMQPFTCVNKFNFSEVRIYYT